MVQLSIKGFLSKFVFFFIPDMIHISASHVWKSWSFKIWSLSRSLLFKYIFKTSSISGDQK